MYEQPCYVEQVHYYAKDIRCTTRYYHFDRYYLYVIHVFDDHELLLHKRNLKNDDINYR